MAGFLVPYFVVLFLLKISLAAHGPQIDCGL
jgi:hypothetical protein